MSVLAAVLESMQVGKEVMAGWADKNGPVPRGKVRLAARHEDLVVPVIHRVGSIVVHLMKDPNNAVTFYGVSHASSGMRIATINIPGKAKAKAAAVSLAEECAPVMARVEDASLPEAVREADVLSLQRMANHAGNKH